MLIPALSMTKGIKVTDCWPCTHDDADRVLKYFVEKGMIKDDGPLSKNAAPGVYIIQIV